MYGESFGGSICNVISERVFGERLFIRTFGSIYLSDKSLYPPNIKNYMFSGDVAWNKLSRKCPNAENNIEKVDVKIVEEKKTLMGKTYVHKIIDNWDSSKGITINRSYYNPFGSFDEWRLHNGYNDPQILSIKTDMYNFFNPKLS